MLFLPPLPSFAFHSRVEWKTRTLSPSLFTSPLLTSSNSESRAFCLSYLSYDVSKESSSLGKKAAGCGQRRRTTHSFALGSTVLRDGAITMDSICTSLLLFFSSSSSSFSSSSSSSFLSSLSSIPLSLRLNIFWPPALKPSILPLHQSPITWQSCLPCSMHNKHGCPVLPDGALALSGLEDGCPATSEWRQRRPLLVDFSNLFVDGMITCNPRNLNLMHKINLGFLIV